MQEQRFLHSRYAGRILQVHHRTIADDRLRLIICVEIGQRHAQRQRLFLAGHHGAASRHRCFALGFAVCGQIGERVHNIQKARQIRRGRRRRLGRVRSPRIGQRLIAGDLIHIIVPLVDQRLNWRGIGKPCNRIHIQRCGIDRGVRSDLGARFADHRGDRDIQHQRIRETAKQLVFGDGIGRVHRIEPVQFPLQRQGEFAKSRRGRPRQNTAAFIATVGKTIGRVDHHCISGRGGNRGAQCRRGH